MACRYPGAATVRQLWENVLARRQQFRTMPSVRLPLDEYSSPDRSVPDLTYGTRAAVIDGFDFDWAARRIPKATYEGTDLVHWLSLEVALQAVDAAGLSQGALPNEGTGVVVGNTLTGEFTRSNAMRVRWPYVRKSLRAAWKTANLSGRALQALETQMEQYYKSVFPPVSEDTLAGALSNTIPGRIANYLNLQAGGYSVDGACSSSLIAIATAARHLQTREWSLAIAGGVDVSLDAFELVGFAKAGALTPDVMRVYDRRGNGFVPGEGCGFVVLKRLDDARRDGNKVLAVVRGWGITSDGKGGITAPNKEGQSRALRRAYSMAGFQASDISFIEGHGTGTKLGDATELDGVALAMDSIGPVPSRGVGLTSFKSIVGHTKAAAGVAGFIKTVVALNRRVVPPTAGCVEPHIAFSRHAGLYPVLTGRIMEPTETMRAGVSAMGFGGINCHIALESGDAPAPELAPSLSERSLLASFQDCEVFLIDAESVPALRSQIDAVKATADGMSEGELPDLARQLATTLGGGVVRASVVASTTEGLQRALTALADQLRDKGLAAGESFDSQNGSIRLSHGGNLPRIGVLFPGQGSQRLGMARVLMERFDWARDLVRRAEGWVGQPLTTLMHPPVDQARDGSDIKAWEAALADTRVAQPAITLTSLLWFRFLQRLGVSPVAAAGHSLGELMAFHVAGGISEESLFKLAALRGQAMSAPSEARGTMASLTCTQAQAEGLLKGDDGAAGYAVVANINGPTQVVISGERAAVESACERATRAGIQAQPLAVSNAFHSALVQPAAERLRKEWRFEPVLGETSLRLHSCINGAEVAKSLDLCEHFAQQVLAPVDFVATVRAMENIDLFIEVGPGRVLAGLVSAIVGDRGPACLTVEPKPGVSKDISNLAAALFHAGQKLEWSRLFDGRLTRQFVPASARSFIVNPCERSFPEGLVPVAVVSAADVADGGLQLPGLERFDNAQLGSYLAKRGAFIAQVIAADLESFQSETDGRKMTPMTKVPVALPVAKDATKSAPATSSQQTIQLVEETLVRMICERTGYPRETVTPDLRLLDDLNMDSIKAGEVIASATLHHGVQGKLDPAALANATIKAIAAAVYEQISLVAGSKESSLSVLTEIIAEKTGFPPDTLLPSLRLLDDLNLDSIKAGELIGEAARRSGAVGRLDPGALANASIADIANAIDLAAGDAGATPLHAIDVVLQELSKLTGFHASSLGPETPLSSQGGISTDMLRRLVELSAARLGVSGTIDLASIEKRTAGELAKVLEMIGRPTPTPVAPPRDSWVREFGMDLVLAPRTSQTPAWTPRVTDTWTSLEILVVADAEEADVAECLRETLLANGATVTVAGFDEADLQGLTRDPRFSNFIAILPRPARQPAGMTPAVLDGIARRLRCIASPPSAGDAPRRRTTLCYVQFGGGQFGRNGCGGRAGLATSFAASVHHERADLRVRVVDVPAAMPPAAIAASVAEELVTSEPYDAVAFDLTGARWRLQPTLLQPMQRPSRELKWTTSDVILITGGAKGITAECALALGTHTNAKLALVGSSRGPSDGSSGAAEVARTLERLHAAGVVVRYYACDVTDANAVAALVGRIESDLGTITGVVHGAGLNRPRRVEHTAVADVVAEIAPKVLGLTNLLQALSDRPPKIFVAMTSIIGVTGMPGNAWYALSNEMVDCELRAFAATRPKVHVASLAYSVWDEVGMGAKLGSVQQLAKLGIGAIRPVEGVRRFLDVFDRAPKDPLVIITARLAGLDTWQRPVPPKLPASWFVETIGSFEPNVEVTARHHLTLDRDRYLADHLYKGTYLFPTVFGLEAMAQAAAYASGAVSLEGVVIEDIRLERPITVDPTVGSRLEIRAQVLEEPAGGGPVTIEAGIYVEQTGFKTPHFSARFVLGAAPALRAELPASEPPLDLDPHADLYGALLFQGPMFQRLLDVSHLDSAKIRFRVEQADPQATPGWGKPALLGDMFARDALLQAGQLVIPKDLCLPVRIDRWIPMTNPSIGPLRAAGTLDGRDGLDYLSTMYAVDTGGTVVERLEGYRLRILDHRPENPSAEELAAPGPRDEAALTKRMADTLGPLGARAPSLALAYLPNLDRATKEERHVLELPVIQRAIGLHARSRGAGTIWLASGKPALTGVDPDLDISLTHDGRLCICVVGEGSQGVDVASVRQRSRDEWLALLSSQRMPVLQELIDGGEIMHLAGTRLWVVAEAARKIESATTLSISLQRKMDSAALFQVTTPLCTIEVITFPIVVSLGPTRVIAVALSAVSSDQRIAGMIAAPSPIGFSVEIAPRRPGEA